MRFTLLILLSLLCFSCKENKVDTVENTTEQSLLSVTQNFQKPKKVSPLYRKEIENWVQHRTVSDFLKRFEKASANEVLSNAKELEGLIKTLKDSINIEILKNNAFRARVNILHNESLRLADMTDIPAISASEVIKQTKKTIDAFSSVNEKINTILTKKNFEDEIKIDVKFIGLDTTKIDSASRKTIKEIREQTLENGDDNRDKNNKP